MSNDEWIYTEEPWKNVVKIEKLDKIIDIGESLKNPDGDWKTNDPVNPNHYKDLGEFSAVHMVPKWGLGFETGQAVKYIQRAGKKPGESEITDLKKAIWYLQRKIHLLDPEHELDPAANRESAPKGRVEN